MELDWLWPAAFGAVTGIVSSTAVAWATARFSDRQRIDERRAGAYADFVATGLELLTAALEWLRRLQKMHPEDPEAVRAIAPDSWLLDAVEERHECSRRFVRSFAALLLIERDDSLRDECQGLFDRVKSAQWLPDGESREARKAMVVAIRGRSAELMAFAQKVSKTL